MRELVEHVRETKEEKEYRDTVTLQRFSLFDDGLSTIQYICVTEESLSSEYGEDDKMCRVTNTVFRTVEILRTLLD